MFHTGRELCGLSTLATPYCGKNRPKNRPKNSPKTSPIVQWSRSPKVQSIFYPMLLLLSFGKIPRSVSGDFRISRNTSDEIKLR